MKCDNCGMGVKVRGEMEPEYVHDHGHVFCMYEVATVDGRQGPPAFVHEEFALDPYGEFGPNDDDANDRTDAEKLLLLADWFDAKDNQAGLVGERQVQADLRRIATLLDAPKGITVTCDLCLDTVLLPYVGEGSVSIIPMTGWTTHGPSSPNLCPRCSDAPTVMVPSAFVE